MIYCKFLKKLLISLFFVTILYFIFSNNIFAFTVNYEGVDYEIPDLPFDTSVNTTYVFGYRSGYSYNYFLVGYPVNPPSNIKVFNDKDGSGTYNNIYRYYKSNGSLGEWYWYSIPKNNLSSWSARKTTSHQFFGIYTKTIFSSVNIYTSSSSNDIYFLANSDDYLKTYYEPRFISTVNELENNTFNNIKVYPGSFADSIYLKLYDISNSRYIVNEPIRNYDSYIENYNDELIYNIPYSAFPNFSSYDLIEDNSYRWDIVYNNQNNLQRTVSITFTIPVVYHQPAFVSSSSDIQNIDNNYLKIYSGSFANSMNILLYNITNNSLIFNIPIKNFDEYIQREDLNNPFSRLIYNIPYSALPSFSYIYDNNYEYRLTYTNENGVLNNMSLFFTPTVTQDINNISNDDINNSIEKQTQQQHEDAQDIKNSIDKSTQDILSTDADEITLDDFGVSSPVIEGSPDLTNIFDLLYNSFMTVYEDNIYRIQFQLPNGSTTYNYDIPADALSSKIPNELMILISVFWWVVLGGAVIRFIVNIIHQVVTYSNGSGESSSGGFLSELTMTPTEFVLFNILH